MKEDLQLDNWLDDLECDWNHSHRHDDDFEPIDYDYSENSYYEGKTIDETIEDWELRDAI